MTKAIASLTPLRLADRPDSSYNPQGLTGFAPVDA
jgi:hypothetical protein